MVSQLKENRRKVEWCWDRGRRGRVCEDCWHSFGVILPALESRKLFGTWISRQGQARVPRGLWVLPAAIFPPWHWGRQKCSMTSMTLALLPFSQKIEGRHSGWEEIKPPIQLCVYGKLDSSCISSSSQQTVFTVSQRAWSFWKVPRTLLPSSTWEGK